MNWTDDFYIEDLDEVPRRPTWGRRATSGDRAYLIKSEPPQDFLLGRRWYLVMRAGDETVDTYVDGYLYDAEALAEVWDRYPVEEIRQNPALIGPQYKAEEVQVPQHEDDPPTSCARCGRDIGPGERSFLAVYRIVDDNAIRFVRSCTTCWEASGD